MLRVPLDQVSIKRTIEPLYANTQATPWGCFLDPSWNNAFDIYPGTVMARKTKERVVPYTGATGQKPWGLSALFVAPGIGIDEVSDVGSNEFAVWVGDKQAFFKIHAPAFDTTANWDLPNDGSQRMLTATNQGKLTTTGVTAANVIGELIDVEDENTILVTLNQYDLGSGGALAGGS